jgi:hypothetical protein
MPFAGVGGTSIRGGYAIDNSVRFNDNDSAYLNRTPASASNRTTWTWSAWIKRSAISTGNNQTLWNAGSGEADDIRLTITNNDQIVFGTDATTFLLTSQRIRDVSAWYHIVFAFDTTQGTASDRAKLYINGSLVSSFSTDNRASLSGSYAYNNTVGHAIGRQAYAGSTYYDGYMTEINFIDGQQLSPTDFGEFDEDSGIWKPKQYSGSYGTNGFYLDFENSGSLGADQSGNGNNFTPNNFTATDQTTDTPTNNFATGNPLARSRFSNQGTISEGNLKYNALSNDRGWLFSSQGISQGKWYWEVKITAIGRFMVGVGYESVLAFNGTFFGNNPSKAFSILDFNGNLYYDGTNTSYGSSLSVDDIVMVALDMDNYLCWFGKNGTWFDSATQSEIENSTATNDATTQMGTQQNLNSGEPVFPFMTCQENGQTGGGIFNFGNPPFSISSGNSDGNGYGNFEYAPPSGYLALCTQNLATELSPTIDDGSQYFNTVLYTGNGTNPRSLTGVGFQPDFTWIKNRTDAWGHGLADSTRGGGKTLITNSTAVEQTNYTWGYLDSFDSDGFTVDDGASGDDFVNQTSDNYVAWNWLVNGGSTSSNTDGSITSTVQANTTAGFSIVTYTGNATAGATVGHGLGTTPALIILKSRSSADNWMVGHKDYVGNPAENLQLDSTSALSTADDQQGSTWYRTPFTSTVFTLGDGQLGDWTGRTNGSGKSIIGYCFAEIEGYSKFGKFLYREWKYRRNIHLYRV